MPTFTPPASTAVDFALASFTPPASTAVDFEVGTVAPPTGAVLDPSSGSTNGSGVLTTALTSDDALTTNGEVLLITATIGGTVIARVTGRPA